MIAMLGKTLAGDSMRLALGVVFALVGLQVLRADTVQYTVTSVAGGFDYSFTLDNQGATGGPLDSVSGHTGRAHHDQPCRNHQPVRMVPIRKRSKPEPVLRRVDVRCERAR